MRFKTAAALTLVAGSAAAADLPLPGGHAYLPESSIQRPADRGVRAHTHLQFFVPDGGLPMTAANTPGGFYETPASLACVYHLVTAITGCSPARATAVSAHGNNVIAIVDAYDNPNAQADLAQFAAEFGLPAPSKANFEVVYAKKGSSTTTTTPPPEDSTGGWELEESLDVQMAHAMAPHAKVILVEAHSSSFSDLFPAVTLASNLVAAAGGGEVSMSWGTGDFAGETAYDTYFQTPGVVYFASAGDSAGVSYPSSSPYVVSAGGTTINRNAATGNYEAESAWGYTGGGATPNEPTPSYQSALASTLGGDRGTPDLAFNADPRTGVWIYDTFPYEGTASTWWIVGGTSESSPGLAGLVNAAGGFAQSTNAELTLAYGNRGNAKDFHDVTLGNCGDYAGLLAAKGWDFCTGIGSIYGLTGK
jgi:subtilase family serine protease